MQKETKKYQKYPTHIIIKKITTTNSSHKSSLTNILRERGDVSSETEREIERRESADVRFSL